MKTESFVQFLTVATMFILVTMSAWAQELQLHGRVSYDLKGLMVKNATDKEWERATLNTLLLSGDVLWVDQGGLSEIELAGGNFLRLADGSKAELKALPPTADVHCWVGSFYAQRTRHSQGRFILTTPSCQVNVLTNSCIRIDIDEKSVTTISVRWGNAEVQTDGSAPVRLEETQRVWVDPGFLPSPVQHFDRAENDSFTLWNNDRAKLLANGYQTLPKEVETASYAVGVSDLASYGEWVYVDSRPYWRPTTVVDYVPFRHGCWNYSSAIGNVWVGSHPFCYVTSHYGRWSHVKSYGWVWSYDPIWSPAWATTVCAGDYLMWAPMGFDSRPVVVTESARFGLGGVNFCVSSTSWMPMSYVTTGWAEISPCTTVLIDSVSALSPAQINVWNINVNMDHHNYGPHPHPFDRGLYHERFYNPPHNIRGFAGRHDGPGPGTRVQALETRMGRNPFAAEKHIGVHMEQSSGGRDSSLRSVRLEKTSALQPDTDPGLAEMRHGRFSDGGRANSQIHSEPNGQTLRPEKNSNVTRLPNDTASPIRPSSLTRTNTELKNSMPNTENKTFERNGARTPHSTASTTTSPALERSVPHNRVSQQETLSHTTSALPSTDGASRLQKLPKYTSLHSETMQKTPNTSPLLSTRSHSDSELNSNRSLLMSDRPTVSTLHSSRPSPFDTGISQNTSSSTPLLGLESARPQRNTTSSRLQNRPHLESSAPLVQRSNSAPMQQRMKSSHVSSPSKTLQPKISGVRSSSDGLSRTRGKIHSR